MSESLCFKCKYGCKPRSRNEHLAACRINVSPVQDGVNFNVLKYINSRTFLAKDAYHGRIYPSCSPKSTLDVAEITKPALGVVLEGVTKCSNFVQIDL